MKASCEGPGEAGAGKALFYTLISGLCADCGHQKCLGEESTQLESIIKVPKDFIMEVGEAKHLPTMVYGQPQK